MNSSKTKIGIALGSGSARGWAHVGVLRELAAAGVMPDLICGSSIGALIGAVYACGKLDEFEAWIRDLDTKEVVRYFDFSIRGRGGLIEGKRLFDFFRDQVGELAIEDLERPYASVATDLVTGREVWLQSGPVLDAMRASIALPGLFTPLHRQGTWLADGGLVNPVPVSLCRAMGAEVVIAVDLSSDVAGRRVRRLVNGSSEPRRDSPGARLLDKILDELKQRASALALPAAAADAPGMFDVMADSLTIMQERITRSRMAGDPPDLRLAPRVAHIGLLEFDRADEAITEGRASVRRMLPALADITGTVNPADQAPAG